MQENYRQQTATQSNSTSPTSVTSKTSDSSGSPVRITTTIAGRQWNDLLSETPQATPYHQYEFLETLASYTNTTLHPLVGLQNDRPIGLFPVFEKSLGPLTALLSPAPKLKARYLGPLLLETGSPTATERRNHAFVDATLSCLESRFAPNYMHFRTTPAYSDHRPFRWAGFEANPQYSYLVDLSPDPSTLLDQFSSDARNNIRTSTSDIRIGEADETAIPPLVDQLQARHETRNESYHVTAAFVTDLYDRLPDGVVRPYTVRRDDTILGGMITLEYGDTVHRWQGGVKPDVDLPVNDLLDWHIMQRAAERDCRYYDLVGANHRSIARYKAKFDPELVTFQSLVKSSAMMEFGSRIYRYLR
jgi:hypothetical protein